MTNARYNPLEHAEQCEVITWCKNMSSRWPEYSFIFAVPNGQSKDYKAASYFKAEGLKAGVPDLCWPLPTEHHHGLFIEMKRRHGGTVSQEQNKWLVWLRGQGYRVEVCKGSTEAIRVLSEYWEEYQERS